jgi:hypothetical protein
MSSDARHGHQRLAALSEAQGFRLAPGEPDIRGWGLFDRSGTQLGTIQEILVDTGTDEVRALVISKTARGGGPGEIVFPIDDVLIDGRQRAVFTDLSPQTFASLGAEADDRRSAPSSQAPVSRAEAQSTSATVERTADGEQIIKVPIIEEKLVVERRPVVKEVVVIRKKVVEGTQVVDADLRKERLEIDRKDK